MARSILKTTGAKFFNWSKTSVFSMFYCSYTVVTLDFVCNELALVFAISSRVNTYLALFSRYTSEYIVHAHDGTAN
jgi:hypothetical protein